MRMKVRIAAAESAGSYHSKNGIPCQDKTGINIDEEAAIAVISDGAGSKSYAEQSADMIVSAAIDYFKTISKELSAITEDSFRSGLAETIYGRFGSKNVDEYGGTLVLAAVTENCLFTAHMGDGIIIKLDNSGESVLSAPENGEYSNMSFFFPGSSEEHLRVSKHKIYGDFTLILASDGISDLIFSSSEDRAAPICRKFEMWNQSFEPEEAGKIYEDNLNGIFSKYSSDDKSIAVISVRDTSREEYTGDAEP